MTSLNSTQLDTLFDTYKTRIIQLLRRYQAQYSLLNRSPVYNLWLHNKDGKPCTPQYLQKQNKILQYSYDDQLIPSMLQKDFYGFVNTRIVGSQQSSQCSMIQHTVDFNDTLSVMKVNDGGQYVQYCDHKQTYYVVSGEQLHLVIDGLELVGDSFEFIVYPEFSSVIVQSDSDFNISQYRVSAIGNSVTVRSNVTGFVELQVMQYVDMPVKIDGLLQFNVGDVVKQYLQVNNGDEITIEQIPNDYRLKQFIGILKCVRWWKHA